MNKSGTHFALVCLGVALSFAPIVRAQSLEEQLRACSAETDAARRLHCYDRAAASIDTGATAPAPHPSPVAVATPGNAETTPADSKADEFGVSEGPLAAKKHAAAIKQITANVSAVQFRPGGQLLITLDNNQVWLQNQAVPYFPLKVGDTVEIRVAAIGSYSLLAPSKRATKVTRVR